jgi:hypothetical protein
MLKIDVIDKINEDGRLGMREPDGFMESNLYKLVFALSSFRS